jgi:hypothetical protein
MEEKMAEEKFDENLMRMMAAQLHFISCVIAGREMFGRGYFSLGVSERTAVDQAVFGAVGGNYQAITPVFLTTQQSQQPMGFGVQPAAPTQGKS